MTGTGTVSVVICAYTEERWRELVEAIASVQRQTVQPLEIILVIDHHAGLLLRARENLAGMQIVENLEARGLSGARNSGIAAARGGIIAFIDEDASAAPDWLAQLLGPYADPRVLGVGGSIEPRWPADRPHWFPDEFDWVVGCTYRGLPTVTSHVRNLIGCNMSFRREVFGTVAGFRSGIGRIGTRPTGCEETELCVRLGQRQPQGWLLYEPCARVYHRIPAWRATWKYFLARCYSEGLSKARVSQLVGAKAGLASERAYTFQTLPGGVARYLADVVRHRDLTGLARAAAIGVGLAFTAVGFLAGALTLRFTSPEDGDAHRSSIADPAD